MIDNRNDPLPRDIAFDRDSVVWCWENINALIEGFWPASRPSGYTDNKAHVQRGVARASFETACLAAAEVRLRARKCGLDGYLVEDRYLNSLTEQEIARSRHLRLDDVCRRISKVLWYSSSGRNQRRICDTCGKENSSAKSSCKCGGALRELGYEEWKRRSSYNRSRPEPKS